MFVKPTIAFSRIDFGSPWYARCANESPSTASSTLTETLPARRCAPSSARSPRARPRRPRVRADRRSRPARRRRRSACPRRSSLSVPFTAAGTSGTPASSAMRAAPERGLASKRFTSPFVRRVPSGNIATTWPSRASCTAVSIACDVALPPPHRKRAGAVQDVLQRRPVELGLRHETEEALGPERHPEHPGVEARNVVAGEDEAALRKILLAPRPQPVKAVKHRRGEDSDQVVEGRRPHARSIQACSATLS